ncbi:MAG: glycine--tRNA ligase [Candidatus Levybacteria bacterium]|nr:glycine--tRNA ligase [Candidatus Levybacteria bacterium]
MEKIVALCKRRGFIYPGSEIYGGITGFWDYGPLGVELKNNIKREWWKSMVYDRDDVVGIDAAIIMNPEVWKSSGHLEAFTDPLRECKLCHQRFREDHFREFLKHVPKGVGNVAPRKEFVSIFYCKDGKYHKWENLTEPKVFNLLTEVFLGVTEPKQKAYLRGEITQGAFVNFKNVVDSTRIKIPFGIAQIGKAFRNEITPGNFTFRSREFEQMELEFFVEPNEKEAVRWFTKWKEERMQWYVSLGMNEEKLRFRKHGDTELAHYAKAAEDIEYEASFGWSEFEGIHNRGDWDLSKHKLTYKDEETGKELTPWVIETSGGVDRSTLFFLIDSYFEDAKRVVLKLHPKLAPYKVAVFPLLANKPELVEKAKGIYKDLKKSFVATYDGRGNIGKRYFAQDEIGTPFCITVDFETLENDTVTIRIRDTMKQERVKIDNLTSYILEKIKK